MLTPEEEKQFTPLNCFAFLTMREEGIQKDEIPPAWLCMSDEAREEKRQRVLEMAAETAGRNIPAADLNTMLGGNDVMMLQLNEWKRFETELKQERANGNPRAFFVA